MPAPHTPPPKIHWFARLEHRMHVWREGRARRRGRTATPVPFPGYGGAGWVRLLGRVLILPKPQKRQRGEYASVRGFRSFVGIPVSFAHVTVEIAGHKHTLVTDRGGVIDDVLEIDLPTGWQTYTMSVEGQDPVEATLYVAPAEARFGVVSDIDDTLMVTLMPRPLVAAWNTFVVDEHARQPVPGMSVLLGELMAQHPGSPMVYLSNGAWNVVPTVRRFFSRHLYPQGAMLLTDWGPTHDRMFRSGKEHKLGNLRRLAAEYPDIKWLLIGDDGQEDKVIYKEFAAEHPESVAGVAIRELSTAEAMLAGGRDSDDDHSADQAPWVGASDGAGLLEKLTEVGILR